MIIVIKSVIMVMVMVMIIPVPIYNCVALPRHDFASKVILIPALNYPSKIFLVIS